MVAAAVVAVVVVVLQGTDVADGRNGNAKKEKGKGKAKACHQGTHTLVTKYNQQQIGQHDV